MEQKAVEFQYRDRELSHIEVRLKEIIDFEERTYDVGASFSSDSFYGNVVFKFDSRILDYYPNLKEVRRDSIFELCTLLAKWLIVTGQYRNFETMQGIVHPHLKLRRADSQGEADYIYRDEEKKITLVHPFVQRFDVEEHQLARLSIIDTLYGVDVMAKEILIADASMPKSVVEGELEGLIHSGYIIRIETTDLFNSPAIDLMLSLTGRTFYEQVVQKRSRIVFIIAACESEDKILQKEVLETYKEAIRNPYALEPIFQEHEEPQKNIYLDIFDYIDACEFVIADITYERPSCYIEIGYALAKQKQVLLFIEEDYFKETMHGKVPFDLFATKYQTYKRTDLTDLKNKCDERIKTVQSRRVS